MGHFLDIANRVLVDSQKPLTAKQITKIGIQNDWLHTKGKTPWQTMKSKLSTDILNNKEKTIFMRTEKGLFALSSWSNKKYIADRYQKALLEETIVVFPKSSLSKYISKPGLCTISVDKSFHLLRECYCMERNVAEDDPNVIQLISVFLVRYKDMILTHKRTKRLPEKRLHGFYSVFFGGHLNPNDLPPLFNILLPENSQFLLRELAEEVIIPNGSLLKIEYKGLLYDDSREVSQQHLGIVYDVFLSQSDYTIGERGFLMDSKFEDINTMFSRINDFENWSVFLIKHEKEKGSDIDAEIL